MPGNPWITNGFFDFRGSLMIFTNCSAVSDAILPPDYKLGQK